MGTRQLNLFGDAEMLPEIKRSKQDIFEDYDAFVAKFDKNAPKTTDDCFTPQPVYEAVLDWLRQQVNIEGRAIVRPFYPGGDYQKYEYPENCVVVDNPPFSILAQIVRFYLAHKIDYFLFAPGLTLFSTSPDGDCAIVSDSQITYANGAVVCTGFHTSLFPGVKIMLSANLNRVIRMNAPRVAKQNKLSYPANIVTSALLNKYVRNANVKIYTDECAPVKNLDCGVALFGGGGFNQRRSGSANSREPRGDRGARGTTLATRAKNN